MTFIDGLMIFFAIIILFYIIVFFLRKKGILEKYNLSLYGPFLMFKTTRGINFLKKLAKRKRFLKSYGNFAIIFCLIVMILFVILFIWNFIILLGLSPEQRASIPGPEFALVLPGINPILPIEYLIYILIAFAVAIIVHEFSHGILTFVGELKIKSMGLLYLIIPIGAFVEPDEEQMKKTNIPNRMRIYAVGPLSNFVVFFICLLLFSFIFISAVQPGEGLTVYEVYEDSPAFDIGIRKGAIITEFNGTDLSSYDNLNERFNQYILILNESQANTTITISYIFNKQLFSKNIELTDMYNYIPTNSSKGKGHTGIYSFVDENKNLNMLKNPFSEDPMRKIFYFIALPIMGYFDGYNPITSPFTDSYKIQGPLEALPENAFWIIVNLLYWIAWLNLMVGLFNVLPMMPLDGGFLFNDYIRFTVLKVKKDLSTEKLDKIVRKISLVISLIILFLIIAPFIFRYI
ncbi:MAG: site-2 protease family protein [Thermoplasmatales archaeon]|nr:MAG: site-2 protease family protein [Thermoplasmatales archaeon]